MQARCWTPLLRDTALPRCRPALIAAEHLEFKLTRLWIDAPFAGQKADVRTLDAGSRRDSFDNADVACLNVVRRNRRPVLRERSGRQRAGALGPRLRQIRVHKRRTPCRGCWIDIDV